MEEVPGNDITTSGLSFDVTGSEFTLFEDFTISSNERPS